MRDDPVSIGFLDERYSREPPRVLSRSASPELTVDVRENSRYRWLQFGNGIVQSAMERRRPHRLVLPYTQSMLGPLLFGEPPRHLALLGMGGGSHVRYLRHYLPDARLDAVELNSEIVELARDYFSVAPEPGRLDIHAADARSFVGDRRVVADLILIDLFDEVGTPGWIERPDFYADCHACLSDTGCLSLNLLGNREEEFVAIVTAVREVFAGGTLCTTLVDYENVIVMAFRRTPDELRLGTLRQRALELERRYALPFSRILRNISVTNLAHEGSLVT